MTVQSPKRSIALRNCPIRLRGVSTFAAGVKTLGQFPETGHSQAKFRNGPTKARQRTKYQFAASAQMAAFLHLAYAAKDQSAMRLLAQY